mgnify:CR=1 FL=1
MTALHFITDWNKSVFMHGGKPFRGRSLVGRSEHQIARLGIGRKFQTPRVYQNLTPRRNLELAVKGSHSPLALLFGSLSDRQRRRVQELHHPITLHSEGGAQGGMALAQIGECLAQRRHVIPHGAERFAVRVAAGFDEERVRHTEPQQEPSA